MMKHEIIFTLLDAFLLVLIFSAGIRMIFDYPILIPLIICVAAALYIDRKMR